jgi:hypothetical protein
MTITFEIENLNDAQLLLNLAARLGIKTLSKPKELDATDYLFSTESNKLHLLKAIDYVENGGELIEVDLDILKKQLIK